MFNRLKFGVIACYYCRAGTTGCCHEYSIGKGHLAGCLEVCGFADNGGAKRINNGDRISIVYVLNIIVRFFRTNRSYSVVVHFYQICGMNTYGNFPAFRPMQEFFDYRRSVFTV
ncbi:hypothetical protein R80B4_02567 [Fibrobacteres bacterium R8-0-B4]